MAVLRPIIKPLARLLVGLIAIPIFRLVVRRGFRLAKVEQEMEQDLEQWFRACLILLVATANMEHYIFGWLPLDLAGSQAWMGVFFRLLLAIGVVELMPDQALFSVIHSGTFGLKAHKGVLMEIWVDRMKHFKKALCVHLNRSSPVFLMMAAIFGGDPSSMEWVVGWVCYGLAATQYLVITLVTASYKSGDLIGKYDKVVAMQRKELISELGDDLSPSEDSQSAEQAPQP